MKRAGQDLFRGHIRFTRIIALLFGRQPKMFFGQGQKENRSLMKFTFRLFERFSPSVNTGSEGESV
jgi:hypothetical protein